MAARVLVIEDNPANLELMIYLLRAFGHKPLAACYGEEGLEVAVRELPDLIICDLQLPGVAGYEVAKQLKGRPATRSIPLVAVSALAMMSDRDRALSAGFDGYIAKPIVPETFVQQLDGFLRTDRRSVPPATDSTTSAAPPAPPRLATVLVVDDSQVNRELIKSTLEPMGYEVILASDVQAALTLASRVPIDLILSDLHMPEANGLDLISAVKSDARLRPIPLLVVTASGGTETERAQTLELGADQYLVRPIEPQALLAHVEAVLRAKKEASHVGHSGG
jgi:two-component system cell cycle response regulator